MNDFLQELNRIRADLGYDERWKKKKSEPRKRVTEQPKLRKTVQTKSCLVCGREFISPLLNHVRDKFRRSDRQCCSLECSAIL